MNQIETLQQQLTAARAVAARLQREKDHILTLLPNIDASAEHERLRQEVARLQRELDKQGNLSALVQENNDRFVAENDTLRQQIAELEKERDAKEAEFEHLKYNFASEIGRRQSELAALAESNEKMREALRLHSGVSWTSQTSVGVTRIAVGPEYLIARKAGDEALSTPAPTNVRVPDERLGLSQSREANDPERSPAGLIPDSDTTPAPTTEEA